MKDFRFDKLRIAGIFVLAIFFLVACTLKGQTGEIRVFLLEEKTKALLLDKKIGVQINDTASTTFHYSDHKGRVVLKLAPGKYNLAIKPEGYELMKVENVEVKLNESTYLTHAFEKSADQKRKRKRR